MKKLIVLFVALALASTAFAADWSFSWDTDYGWASNFDDDWNGAFDELELAVAADIDDYNTFAMEMEPNASASMVLQFNKFNIASDLAAYLGLSGIGLVWTNGYQDLGGDAEYSDFGVICYSNAATDMVNLSTSWTTCLKLTKDAFWVQAAANQNLGVDSTEDVSSDAPERQMQFFAGAVDLIPGLSVEAGVRLDMDDTSVSDPLDGSTDGYAFECDAAYAMDMSDAMALTVGGSFATTDKDYNNTGDVWEQAFGVGAQLDYTVDDMTAVYVEVGFAGNEDESLQDMGGAVGVTYKDGGAEVAVDYNATIDGGDADIAFVDLSAFINIGAVKYRVGYCITDYGLDNSSRGAVPTEGGLYLRLTADF